MAKMLINTELKGDFVEITVRVPFEGTNKCDKIHSVTYLTLAEFGQMRSVVNPYGIPI